MRLERLDLLIEEILASQEIKPLASGVEVFHLVGQTWECRGSDVQSTPHSPDNLTATLKRGTHWRSPRCCPAFFPIADFQVVVVITFHSPSKANTRDRASRELLECIKRSSNKYEASYDFKTGLLSERAFDEHSARLLQHTDKSGVAVPAETAAPSETETAILLALDVDNFKHVNDAYGHAYGDIVLKCLGQRLSAAAKTMRIQESGAKGIVLGRAGGEEFLILIRGAFGNDRLKELAERFRAAIGGAPLPSPGEWEHFQEEVPEVALPPDGERKVTVSIGIATTRLPGAGDPRGILGKMRSRADRALYSAKAGGRNVAHNFDDILLKYGRVVEHDLEANLVVVDVGRGVGVQEGQEFEVFLKKLSGGVSCVLDDGRTRKAIGVYPRIPSGRVIVLNVQEDVSFCRVAKSNLVGAFPVGSLLEAIPLGSIRHLLSDAGSGGVLEGQSLDSVSAVQSKITSVSASGEPYVCVAFGIVSEVSVHQQGGSALVNRILAQVCTECRSRLPRGAILAQMESTKVCAVLAGAAVSEISASCQTIVDATSRAGPSGWAVACGVFAPAKKKSKIKNDESVIDSSAGLDYARVAMEAALGGDDRVVVFSPAVAASLVDRLRKAGALDRATEDYERLTALGVRYAVLDNLAALAEWEKGNRRADFVLKAIGRGLALEPTDPIMIANRGFFLYHLKNKVEAFEAFVEAKKHAGGGKLDPVFALPQAGAAIEAFGARRDPGEWPQVREMVEVGLEHARLKGWLNHVRRFEAFLSNPQEYIDKQASSTGTPSA